MKKRRRAVVLLMAVVLLLLAALGFAGNFFFEFALCRDSARNMHTDGKSPGTGTGEGAQTSPFGGTQAQRDWYESARADRYLTSADGLSLHAYYMENAPDSHLYAIVCHGYTSSAEEMVSFIRSFYDMGFHVLAPEARAHGKSGGAVRGMGWLERKDMLLWIDALVSQDPQARIVLHGVSMGGATVLMTSGEALPENVRAIVEDCGYTSVWDEFSAQIRQMFGLPAFPFMQAASLVTRVRGGYWLSEASALEQVKKSVTPTLFIHGDQDTFVPFAMLDTLYQAASCEKEKLVVAGAGHGMAAGKDPALYWDTIRTFLEKHVGLDD